jgi:hypothetical protein
MGPFVRQEATCRTTLKASGAKMVANFIRNPAD